MQAVSNNPSHSSGSVSLWSGQKRFVDVLGRQMAYFERGDGHPVVFIHGNPTSSFLWRNVLPHVERSGRRLIAPDLIGMGDSDKIPAGAEPDRYRFVSQARYLEAFINEVVGTSPITLVLHDWGGALGFDWAYRHKERVHAIAYMETFVTPLTLSDLQWPREVPLSGAPADVYQRIADYSTWLQVASMPKLFIDAEPSVFITGRVRKLVCSFPNQQYVLVKGLHFIQKDSPNEIGRAINNWLEQGHP